MIKYIQINPNTNLEALKVLKPYKAIVVVEIKVNIDWQIKVSEWLVDSGCKYMMAWGMDCSSWDDTVDEANLEDFDYGDIPDDKFVMTTWHEKQDLGEVFWFCKNCARHENVDIKDTLIVHVSKADRSKELLEMYDNV